MVESVADSMVLMFTCCLCAPMETQQCPVVTHTDVRIFMAHIFQQLQNVRNIGLKIRHLHTIPFYDRQHCMSFYDIQHPY